jgi:LysM domain
MAIDRLGSGIENVLHDVVQGPVATVQVGESELSQVAKRLGEDPARLAAANPQISDPTKLMVGQDIHLPQSQGPAVVEEHFETHSLDQTPVTHFDPPPAGDPLVRNFIESDLTAKTHNLSETATGKAPLWGANKATELLSAAPGPAQREHLTALGEDPVNFMKTRFSMGKCAANDVANLRPDELNALRTGAHAALRENLAVEVHYSDKSPGNLPVVAQAGHFLITKANAEPGSSAAAKGFSGTLAIHMRYQESRPEAEIERLGANEIASQARR